MYVSVTGLRTKNFYTSIRFWLLTIPAFRAAQKANGILFCENRKKNGYHHTLTVWESKKYMIAYFQSPLHTKAMRAFPSIATGKVFGYESKTIPPWDKALKEWELNARG